MTAFLERFLNSEHKAPALFTASSIWLSVAQMLSGVVLVHYVAPREMGLWSSVSLALTYSMFLLAGVQNGLSRELPYFLGANDQTTASRLAAVTLFCTCLGCVLIFVLGIASDLFLVWHRAESNLIFTVLAMTFLVIFQFYQYYLFVTYRSKSSFIQLAGVQSWQGLIMVAALPLVVFFGFHGMLLRAVTVAALGLLLMHRIRPIRVSPAWSASSFLLMLKTGVPIFLTDYIRNVASTFDRVALLHFGGVEQVGFYSLAATANAAFQVVPQSIAHYIYPRMSHHYGRTNDPNVLRGMAWKVTLLVVLSMVPLAIIGSLMVPFAVKLLFPKYIPGIKAAQILLFSAIASGATIGSNALASLKSWSHLLWYQLSYSLVLAVGPFAGVALSSSPLLGVAYGVLFTNIVGAVLAIAATYLATRRRVTGIAATSAEELASQGG